MGFLFGSHSSGPSAAQQQQQQYYQILAQQQASQQAAAQQAAFTQQQATLASQQNAQTKVNPAASGGFFGAAKGTYLGNDSSARGKFLSGQ